MHSRTAWVFAALIVLQSCGGDDSTAGGTGAQQCLDACARLAACNVGNDICAPGGCKLWTDRWRPEFSNAYFGCLLDTATPCTSAGAESCFARGASAITVRPTDKDYLSLCLQKRTTCMNPYSDDYCASTMLSEAWLSQARACLDQACGDVAACLKMIFKP